MLEKWRVMKGRKPENVVASTHTFTDAPRPPSWLSKAAKAEWRNVATIMVERGHLTMADLGTLAAYCNAVGLLIDTTRQIEAEGIVIDTKNGPRKHPAISVQGQARDQVRRLAAELGLTPISRSRPAVRDTKNDDDEDLSPLDL